MEQKHGTIWLVSKYAVAPNMGNPTRQFYFSKYFGKKGFNTLLISSQSSNINKYITLPNFFHLEEYEYVKCFLLRGPKINLGFSLKRIWSWLIFEINLIKLSSKIGKQHPPQYIIVSSLSLLTILTGLYLKLKYKSKLIFEVRDIWPLTIIEIGNYSKYNPFIIILRFIEKIGYYYSDAVVGTMPNLKEHVAKSIKKKAVFSIYQGFYSSLPLNSLSLSQNTRLAVQKVNNKQFNIAYSGTIGEANDIDTFLNAIVKLEQENIHIYLYGEGVLKSELENRFQKYKNIHFENPINYEDLPFLLSNFDLLIVSIKNLSIYKFGISFNKLTDYLRSGVPIFMIYNGYQSVAEEAGAAFVIRDTYDANKIAEAIIGITKLDKSVLLGMGAKGKEYADNYLTFDYLSDKYINIIRSI